MAYCTTGMLKGSLVFEYWKSISLKLVEDGYIVTADTFPDEAAFLSMFTERAASFIDSYCNGPFAPNSVLSECNRVLALYDAEQYFLSAQSDRQINVSIDAEKKRILKILDKVNDGDIIVIRADDGELGTENRAPSLAVPSCAELLGGVQGSDCFDFLTGTGYE